MPHLHSSPSTIFCRPHVLPRSPIQHRALQKSGLEAPKSQEILLSGASMPRHHNGARKLGGEAPLARITYIREEQGVGLYRSERYLVAHGCLSTWRQAMAWIIPVLPTMGPVSAPTFEEGSFPSCTFLELRHWCDTADIFACICSKLIWNILAHELLSVLSLTWAGVSSQAHCQCV
jgi:hypothetical protein